MFPQKPPPNTNVPAQSNAQVLELRSQIFWNPPAPQFVPMPTQLYSAPPTGQIALAQDQQDQSQVVPSQWQPLPPQQQQQQAATVPSSAAIAIGYDWSNCAAQLHQLLPQIVSNFAFLLPQIQQNPASTISLPALLMGQTASQAQPQIVLNYSVLPQSQNPVSTAFSVSQMAQTSLPQPQLAPNCAQNLLPMPNNPLFPQQCSSSQPIPSARPTKTAKWRRKSSKKPRSQTNAREVNVSGNVAVPVNLQLQNLNNNMQNVGPIRIEQLSIRPGAKKIHLDWTLALDLPNPTSGKYKFRLMVVKLDSAEQFADGVARKRKRKRGKYCDCDYLMDKKYGFHIRKSQFIVTPGCFYSIVLSVENTETGEVVAEEKRRAKAVFSSDEMQKLLDKAIEFAGTEMHPFKHLYRCKPQSYWDSIGSTMEVYVKDNNGQAASPINQNIRGLFFMASTPQQGILPDFSPFGNALPAQFLLAQYWLNLYFSDFYCYKRSKHYVQLVVTLQNSVADNFCRQQKLPALDLFDNPFLRFSLSQQMYFVNKNEDVWVEIFYTENVERSEYWFFDTVRSRGEYGEGLTESEQHNKYCLHCNLYPIDPIPTHSNHSHEQSSGFYEGDTFEESTEVKENVNVPHQPNVQIECCISVEVNQESTNVELSNNINK